MHVNTSSLLFLNILFFFPGQPAFLRLHSHLNRADALILTPLTPFLPLPASLSRSPSSVFRFSRFTCRSRSRRGCCGCCCLLLPPGRREKELTMSECWLTEVKDNTSWESSSRGGEQTTTTLRRLGSARDTDSVKTGETGATTDGWGDKFALTKQIIVPGR